MLILHDVCWPYGRRDLYYNPDQIPPEFRQPYARRGMRPDRKQLLARGGMNVTLENAEIEGGPRNGVMTALDDFIAEHDEPLRLLVIPIYFGLAIVAEERLLDDHPELRRLLDEFESEAGKQHLLELSEQIRIDATVFEHNIMRVRDEQLARANDRYLALLRGALLDEHYLENEVRIEYLLECTSRAQAPRTPTSRAPRTPSCARSSWRSARRGSSAQSDERRRRHRVLPVHRDGRGSSCDHLDAALRTIRDEAIAGDLVECGPGRGGAGVYMRGFLEANELTDRQVWIAGRFRSSPAGDAPTRPLDGGRRRRPAGRSQPGAGGVRAVRPPRRARALPAGRASTRRSRTRRSSSSRSSGSARDSAPRRADALEQLYDRVSPGGFVIVEYNADPAVSRRGRRLPATTRDHEPDGARRLVGTGVAQGSRLGERHDRADRAASPRSRAARTAGAHRTRSTCRSSSSSTTCAAKRRARCTRCRARTSGESTISHYEVIVVENGSDDAGASRRGVRHAASGPSSGTSTSAKPRRRHRPTRSTGASGSRAGSAFALMIDGAHVVTPGVLRFGMAGLRTYEPAIVATQQWYVGPGQQPVVVDKGYDQTAEDELFAAIGVADATATGSSRSATSSASATGSTGCSRATASSSPGRCSSRSAASTTASRCPAAATRTSTSGSVSPRRPRSRW